MNYTLKLTRGLSLSKPDSLTALCEHYKLKPSEQLHSDIKDYEDLLTTYNLMCSDIIKFIS